MPIDDTTPEFYTKDLEGLRRLYDALMAMSDEPHPLEGTFDADPRVIASLSDGDRHNRRSFATYYRIYPQPNGAPVMRIASHADRASIDQEVAS